MQQDIQSNGQNSSWKARLEEDVYFDDAIINDGAAWNKLYIRLHTPGRKKTAWYWIAAAVLIVAVICGVAVKQTITSGEFIAPTPVVQTKKSTTPTQKTAVPGYDTTKADIPSAMVKTGKPPKRAALKNTAIITPVAVNTIELVKEDTLLLPTEIPMVNNAQLAVETPKAKLKVVHVNELGVDEPNKSGKRGGDYSVIQIGVNHNKPIPSNSRIGIQISTSKTSSSN